METFGAYILGLFTWLMTLGVGYYIRTAVEKYEKLKRLKDGNREI